MRLLGTFSFKRLEALLFSLLILFLPTQLGKHFWPDFAFIDGIRVDYLSPTVYVTDVLIVFLFFVWLCTSFLKKNHTFSRHRVYFLFIGFLLTTIILSASYWSGLYSLVKFLEYSFLFFYIVFAIPRVVSLQKIASLLSLATIAESLLALVQYFNQGSVGGLFYFVGERSFTASTPGIANASLNGELVLRAYGTFPHPNVLAGFLLVSMILVFFYLYTAHRKSLRFFAACSLLLGSAALILTLSRMAIALWILFVMCLFLGQLAGKKFKRDTLWRSLRWMLLLVLLVTVFLHVLAPRFLETSLTEESVVQRQQLTQASLQMVVERPVIGVGLGNFLSALDASHSPFSIRSLAQPVHTIFLLVLAEIGVIGLSFFIWFLGKTYKRLLLKKHLLPALPITLCLSVILVTGMVDHYWLTLQQGQLLFTLILGLAWSKAFHDVPFG